MVKHNYDDLIITVGALVLGLGLLKFLEDTTRAYASNVINCDKPAAPTKADKDFAKTLPPDQRQEYLKGAVADFKSICAQERRRRVGDDTHGSTYREPTYPSTVSPHTKTFYPAVPDAVVGDIRSEYAYAYAGAACASACSPFKNSPGTYATCCKQHAATAAAAKPKPAAPKPAVLKSRFPAAGPLTTFQKANPLPVTKSKVTKPKTADQLQQGQVKKVVGTLNTEKGLPKALKSLNDAVKNAVTPPTSDGSGGQSSTPSNGSSGGGGSGKIFGPEIKCHTGCNKQCGKSPDCKSNESPRLQYGVFNDSPEVDFNVTVKIPSTWKGVDSATLQVGGVAHHDNCNTDGYKAYVGINGGDNGIGTETGDKHYTDLHAKCDPNVGNLRPGQTYRLRALKRNVGQSVQVNTWVNDKPHCSVTHAQGILGRKWISKDCPAVDQLRVDGWPDTDLSNAISVSSGPPG